MAGDKASAPGQSPVNKQTQIAISRKRSAEIEKEQAKKGGKAVTVIALKTGYDGVRLRRVDTRFKVLAHDDDFVRDEKGEFVPIVFERKEFPGKEPGAPKPSRLVPVESPLGKKGVRISARWQQLASCYDEEQAALRERAELEDAGLDDE